MKTFWIETVPYDASTGELRKVYDATRTPHGTVDNVYRAQSLLPGSIEGHDRLYKAVLHPPRSVLDPWFSEAVAVYTSLLNACSYAVTHHGANLRHLLADAARAEACLTALRSGDLADFFNPKEIALLDYVRALTLAPRHMTRGHIDALRQAGASDEEILHVNQVCACFNYTNRVINGLGVEVGDDVVGFY